jgi:predicted metal-dependent phosphoesterase TrpH
MAGVDLHLHSAASDGDCAPEDLARAARAAGLDLIALTDHDTVTGVSAARAAAEPWPVTIIAGCEFSVAADWGEMHLLAYYLPVADAELEAFLQAQRSRRASRGREIVRRLQDHGLEISEQDVRRAAGNGAVGRPHVAKALVERRLVRDIPEAFDRWLASGRPAYVPKELPALAEVVALVRSVGGVTSAAHLGERAQPDVLDRLKRAGVDAVEVVHPTHDPGLQRRIAERARRAGLLVSGGSDWHGDRRADEKRGALGSVSVPREWAEELHGLHLARAAGREAAS